MITQTFDSELDSLLTQWGVDSGHEFQNCQFTYPTQGQLDKGDHTVCEYDLEYSSSYTQHTQTRDALKTHELPEASTL